MGPETWATFPPIPNFFIPRGETRSMFPNENPKPLRTKFSRLTGPSNAPHLLFSPFPNTLKVFFLQFPNKGVQFTPSVLPLSLLIFLEFSGGQIPTKINAQVSNILESSLFWAPPSPEGKYTKGETLRFCNFFQMEEGLSNYFLTP